MGDFFPDLSKGGRVVETKRGEKCKKVLPEYLFALILHPENSKDDNIAAVQGKEKINLKNIIENEKGNDNGSSRLNDCTECECTE